MSIVQMEKPPESIPVKGRDLQKYIKEKGIKRTLFHLQESYKKKEITPDDFSFRDLTCNLVEGGHEMVADWARAQRGGHIVTEAVDAVDTSAMANITGQIFFNKIKDALTSDEFIGDRLVGPMPSNIQGEELVGGIGLAADVFNENVTEGEPYPLAGLTEEYVTVPAAEKKGVIIGLTREVIIADKTGQLLARAKSVGNAAGIRREKSILDVVLGVVNPYRYKGEVRLTYGDGATAGQAMGFLNEATAALNNYTDVQEVADLFYAMRDPVSEEPFTHSPTTIVCGKAPAWAHRAVVRDTEVRLDQRPVLAAGANAIMSVGKNRIPWNLEILSNEWVIQRTLLANGLGGGIVAADRAAANLHWWIGKPTEAFVWKEIWPFFVEEAPNNNEAQFTSDVFLRFKTGYKGVAGVIEPRLMIRSDGTA